MATDERSASKEPKRDSRDIGLYYFEEVLPVEFATINARRARHRERGLERGDVKPVRPRSEAAQPPPEPAEHESRGLRARSPDPEYLFRNAELVAKNEFRVHDVRDEAEVRASNPDRGMIRPRPVPCDATGLAFSGGGIRSAAVCLGGLQALQANRRLASLDYLSTVSGGGYTGSCLSAAMTPQGGGVYPFGADISDSPAVAHLRNYSNYLMPRGRSGVRNLSEAAALVLRGLLANAVVVAAVMLLFVLVTVLIYPRTEFGTGSVTLKVAAILAIVLMLWAVARSYPALDEVAGDTQGRAIAVARSILLLTLIVGFLDLQPIAIRRLIAIHDSVGQNGFIPWLQGAAGALTAFTGVVSFFASSIGNFLEKSERARGLGTFALRFLTRAALVVAALVLPALLWLAYLWLSARAIAGWGPSALESMVADVWWMLVGNGDWSATMVTYSALLVLATGISLMLTANGYSLHRFYRDRLSRAFLFGVPDPREADPPSLDTLKLSALRNTDAPYHIINSAMNVQGSKEANRRGRNADFFMFTSHFVGSDLTLYTRASPVIGGTSDMEAVDPRLDLATAMAISGAAVSANMGSNTVRLLSPTLALLNVRLGYWLRNPRWIARTRQLPRTIHRIWQTVAGRFFLMTEMLNLHDEKSARVYLTDGGHIENLGLYELLKRGCQLIIVIDAEADPTMSFPSLLKVERYARIDLGVRIILPWEKIAAGTRQAEEALTAGERPGIRGPHCAVGRIIYEDGAEGILLYCKSSVSGDEKDYILDYKRRHPDFPHETTGDQFFSEEQFEMYRGLGFHMVSGFFSGDDAFPFLADPALGAINDAAVRALVNNLLPTSAV